MIACGNQLKQAQLPASDLSAKSIDILAL